MKPININKCVKIEVKRKTKAIGVVCLSQKAWSNLEDETCEFSLAMKSASHVSLIIQT